MKNETERLALDLLPEEPRSGSGRLPNLRSRPARACGRDRADWWFDQMRRVVEEGRDFPVNGVW
jgi:hypothetical protein